MSKHLSKKAKNDFENGLLSWWIIHFLEKICEETWEMWGNIKRLNLSQQKEERAILCQNQIIME